jgi:predicted amidohydrolase YtcJ
VITKGARPLTLSELDALAPNNPVYVLESNGHVAYVNTSAYRAAHVTRDTQDPRGGRFLRDAAGELSGQVEAQPAHAVFFAEMPQLTLEQVRSKVRKMLDRASTVGCTTLHDGSIGALSGTADLAILRDVMTTHPPVRIRGMLISTLFSEWEKQKLKPGFGDDLFAWTGSRCGRMARRRRRPPTCASPT